MQSLFLIAAAALLFLPVVVECIWPFSHKTTSTHGPGTSTPSSKHSTSSHRPTHLSPVLSPSGSHIGGSGLHHPITDHCRRVTYTNLKDSYCGEFSTKFRHGDGIRHFGNGAKYCGQYQLDGVTGVGYWQEPHNGGRYLGQLVNKQKQGHGYMQFADGSEYMGEFNNNQMHGQGIYKWANGKIFIGKFLSGKPTQGGTTVNSDGTVDSKGHSNWAGF